MGKRNKESSQNNWTKSEIKSTNIVATEKETDHEFSEELSDGGERNEIIKRQQNK
ncbi:hypothetical protein [Metabacillus bambusae]|uniref:DUF4025 domain-containing protein n=1 Tax=Metabacillus bambusae TaxID=2795218 RepID=A0ABS3N2D9_9BACI|nr:hypothetical protein [Metabacillus bambusae]MBO1512445.1 hypothetical protein [Metabacillus bambusae]